MSKFKKGHIPWNKGLPRDMNPQTGVKRKNRMSDEQKKQFKKEYYLKNKKRLLQYKKQYRQKNKKKIYDYNKEYRLNNTTRMQMFSTRWLSKKWNVICDFTYEEWYRKKTKANGHCQICERYVGFDFLTIDHKIPYAIAPKGFIYRINDVQAICFKCNSSKRHFLYDEMFGEYY